MIFQHSRSVEFPDERQEERRAEPMPIGVRQVSVRTTLAGDAFGHFRYRRCLTAAVLRTACREWR